MIRREHKAAQPLHGWQISWVDHGEYWEVMCRQRGRRTLRAHVDKAEIPGERIEAYARKIFAGLLKRR